MALEIIIENWKELREQFGLNDTITGTRSARQISKQMRKELTEGVPPEVICVDYEHKNVDSGICTFSLVKYDNSYVTYHYTGTAK